MKLLKAIIKTVIISAIPAVLSYLANSSLPFDKLIEWKVLSAEVDIPLVQDWCLWLSIGMTAVLLSLNLIITQHKYECTLEERDRLIKMAKSILENSFVKKYFQEHVDFNMRFFVPKYSVLYWLADRLKFKYIKKKFVIKNIELIADPGITKDLQFEVSPKVEGLVGQCYTKKCVLWDDKLESTNTTAYNLDQHQISRTTDLKWIICCPIYGHTSEIVAILALDGKTNTAITDNEKTLGLELTAFSRMLFDAVPQLFKR